MLNSSKYVYQVYLYREEKEKQEGPKATWRSSSNSDDSVESVGLPPTIISTRDRPQLQEYLRPDVRRWTHSIATVLLLLLLLLFIVILRE